jgi:predicted TIM-barrel fold metal-dependent hydrolase
VRYAILLGQELRPLSTLPDADYAAALAAASNDLLCERWLARDPRLLGAILVATQDPAAAAREIPRVGGRRGMVEALLADGAPMPYGKRYYDPIHQACAELELPVALHTGDEGPSPVGWGSCYIEHRQARPMGSMAHLASMVFEGLWERFPKLQVVFSEGGCLWLPTYLRRLDSDWRGLRHQTPWVKRPPGEYGFEHCRFTSRPIETVDRPQKLLTVFEWAQAERTLMFASDDPHWDLDSPVRARPAMPEGLRRRIMYETASELYRLPIAVDAAAARAPAGEA